MLTVSDILITCAVVILRVKESFLTSVDYEMTRVVSLNHSLLYSVVSMYMLVNQPTRRNTVNDLIDTLSN